MGETRTGLHGFPGHKGHIFLLLSKPKKARWSNAGYQQDVRCVPCKTKFCGVDGEFLQERAEDEDLERLLRRLVMQVKRVLKHMED